MSDFERVAEQLIGLSLKVIDLIKTKNEYARSVNYQMGQLFEQLGESSDHGGVPFIETQNLRRQLSQSQLDLLFCRENRESSYLTPEDLCTFLHISKHNLRRNSTVSAIDPALVDQLHGLLEAELQVEEELSSALAETDLEKWFAEVDFFNNGYIDTSALYEFLLHYDARQQPFEEYNALLLLRIVKRHTLSDKLLLQDFRTFVDRANQVQIFFTNEQISMQEPITSRHETKVEEKHLKKNSNELYSLSSEVSIAPEIRVGPKLIEPQYSSKLESLGLMSRRQVEEELRQQESMTYEERLVRLHARNEKYIREAKRQMEGIIPICNIQIHSHLQVQASRANSAELLRKVKLLGDAFNKQVKLIQGFLSKNHKFTFVNAFSLLDTEETNSVDLARWREFLREVGVQVAAKKAALFFNSFSDKGRMDYSCFLKIFKYAAVEEEYVRCSMRYPLIYEQWSPDLMESYREFLTKMASLVEEREIITENLTVLGKEVEVLFKSFTFAEEVVELLGQEYRSFVTEYFYESTQQVECALVKRRQKV